MPVIPDSHPSPFGTATYSARNPPPTPIQPKYLVPDRFPSIGPPIINRVISALRNGLRQLPHPLPHFPEFTNLCITQHCDDLTDPVSHKCRVDRLFAMLIAAARPLIVAIFDATSNEARLIDLPPELVHSQQGDCYITVNVPADPTLSNSFSVEHKAPYVLFSHGGKHGLQSPKSLNCEETAMDEAAIAIKLSLQITHAEPAGRFGIIYTGHSFMLTELYPLPNNHGTLLLTSPVFSVFSENLLPIPNAFEHNFPEGLTSAPILACIIALACSTLPVFQIEPLPHPEGFYCLAQCDYNAPDDDNPGDNNTPDSGDSSSGSVNSGNSGSDSNYSGDGSSGGDDSGNGGSGGNRPGSDTDIEGDESQRSSMNTIKMQKHRFNEHSYPLQTPFDGLKLRFFSNQPLSIVYDCSWLSSVPRLAVPVSFLPPELSCPLDDSDPLRPCLPVVNTKTPKLLGPPTSKALAGLSPEIHAFLASFPIEAPKLPPTPRCKPIRTPLVARLYEHVGAGRTCDTWHAEIEGSPTPLIVKMISGRYASSVVRESLFYEAVFPRVGLGELVPRYYGTYASIDGGWYAIVLQDVGTAVAKHEMFPEKLAKGVRRIEQAFKKAGIAHGDVAPRNVLRSQDGALRFVDFGYSRLIGGYPKSH